MFAVEIGILSSRCGCSGARRRKRKLLYAGSVPDGLRHFLAESNRFLVDEQHRHAIEYRFAVRCCTPSNRGSAPLGELGGPAMPTWTELCRLIDQFIGFPIIARGGHRDGEGYRVSLARHEHVMVLLLDEDEQSMLLSLLFRLQNTSAASEAEIIAVHSKRVVDGESSTPPSSPPSSSPMNISGRWRDDDGGQSNNAARPPLLADYAENPEGYGDDKGGALAAPPTATVYTRCQQRLMELRQMRDTLDEEEKEVDAETLAPREESL